MRYTIGKKLGLGFGILLLFLVATGFVSYFEAQTVIDDIVRITDKEEPKSRSAYEMEIHAIGTEIGIMTYLFNMDASSRIDVNKENLKFKEFFTEYSKLAKEEKEKSLVTEISEISEELKPVGDSLMYARDYQRDLYLNIGNQFDRVYTFLDQLIFKIVGPNSPDGKEKIRASVKMKASIAEVGNWLGNYIRTRDDIYQQRIAVTAGDFLNNLTEFQSLKLNEEEKARSSEIQEMFSRIHFLTSEIIGIEYAFNKYLSRFTELRTRLHQIIHGDVKKLASIHLNEAKEDGIIMAKRASRIILAVIAAGFFVGGLMLIILTLGITKPVKSLVSATEKFGRGELSERVEISSKDELGTLSKSFNSMAEDLERHIAEKTEIEQELRESKEKYSNLFLYSNDAIIIHDVEGKILDVNRKMAELFGYSIPEVVSLKIEDLHPREAIKKSELEFETIRKKGFASFEIDFLKKDGQVFSAEVSASVFEIMGNKVVQWLVRDITERRNAEQEKKKLERQLVQSQKMEAIGTLAGGIAHDFNNILAGIIGYTELLKLTAAKEQGKTLESLDEIMKAGLRAKDMVNQILTFSRQTEQELKPVMAGIIVKEALKLLRATLPKSIDFKENIMVDSMVIGDPAQIHQIVMNLCTNAYHAMREEGGSLEVELKNVTLDENAAKSHHMDLVPGPYLNLTVSDTGHGMPSYVKERIFEPFFTTKKQGEGTGMGLAVVHGIVRSYEGAIYAESEPGKGSSFEVFLPVVENKSESDKVIENPVPMGTENILFVDDEPALVKMIQQMLTRFGYQVVTSTDSLEALDLFQSQPEKFDLVITDIAMPHMTGDKLSEKIRAIREDIPIILCSGSDSRVPKEKAKRIGINSYLVKPVILEDLINNVRHALDENRLM